MIPCPHCGRRNSAGEVFCGGCGRPLADPADGRRISTAPPLPPSSTGNGGSHRPRVPIPPTGPSRGLVLALGIVGFVALAAATGFKIVTKPGRIVPPINAKLRAAPPPPKGEVDDGDDGDDARPRGPGAASGTKGPPGVRAPIGTKASAGGKAAAATAKPREKQGPDTKAPAKKAPEKKAPELGPPPSKAEIRACIDRRKGRIRSCANRAAENMEFVGGGTAKATMNPNGKFTRIYVPGGGTFASCTASVIRGTTCRKYTGDPITITYPVR